jgi:hypothetical protein
MLSRAVGSGEHFSIMPSLGPLFPVFPKENSDAKFNATATRTDRFILI